MGIIISICSASGPDWDGVRSISWSMNWPNIVKAIVSPSLFFLIGLAWDPTALLIYLVDGRFDKG